MKYYAVKTFNTFNEAVKGVMKSSYSLGQSDLNFISGNNFKEVEESIDRYYDEQYFPSSFGEPIIGVGKSEYTHAYNDNLIENFDLAPMTEEEFYNGVEYFEYCTSTFKNDVKIRVLKEEGEITGYECVYIVESEHPVQYSTAMNEFRKNGWQCSERAYELSEEEEQELKADYERDLIDRIINDKWIPDVYFDLSYEVYDSGEISINAHCICADPSTISTLLKYHPEISEEVLKIIDEKVEKIQAIKLPKRYEFNEEIYNNSDYYSNGRDEVIKALMEVKAQIQEKLSYKDEQLSKLEDEERQIKAAEEMIKTLENPNKDIYKGK